MAAQFNEGDIMEGIFSIAIGLYLAEGKVDKAKLNKFRTLINPSKFVDGREEIVIVKDRIEKLDKVSVDVSLRMKAKSVSAAYGSDYLPLYQKQNDIGNLDRKIDVLIREITNTAFGRKLISAKEHFVNNSKAEKLDFRILADGIAGEQSGGDIKGDVGVSLFVSEDGGRLRKINDFHTYFSLKSESVTVANLSPFVGMQKIMNKFGGNFKSMEKFKVAFAKNAVTLAEKQYVEQIIYEMFDELYVELQRIARVSPKNFSKAAFDFFTISTNGTDLADVVDISRTKIQEINYRYLEILRDDLNMQLIPVKPAGNKGVIRFVNAKDATDTGGKNTLFQLRLKIRTSASGSAERKFYVETGKLAYIGEVLDIQF